MIVFTRSCTCNNSRTIIYPVGMEMEVWGRSQNGFCNRLSADSAADRRLWQWNFRRWLRNARCLRVILSRACESTKKLYTINFFFRLVSHAKVIALWRSKFITIYDVYHTVGNITLLLVELSHYHSTFIIMKRNGVLFLFTGILTALDSSWRCLIVVDRWVNLFVLFFFQS